MNPVTVKIGKNHYRTSLTAGNHEIIADEPQPEGTDQGPNPYDLLLMALGACTAITVRMYADRKGWDLQGIEIDLKQDRVHAEDCELCESKDGFVHKMEKQIRFIGDLDESQIARLLDISTKCPVHRTLQNEIVISEKIIN